MRTRVLLGALGGLALASAGIRTAADARPSRSDPPSLASEDLFGTSIRPFLEAYCVRCHGSDSPKGELDLSRFDRILSLEGGVARVEPGARLGTIEAEARRSGWELRCMPSTWMKSTMGGFLCGGSGGIGSITWGGINALGNVRSVTILTCEEVPRIVRLEDAECLKAARVMLV